VRDPSFRRKPESRRSQPVIVQIAPRSVIPAKAGIQALAADDRADRAAIGQDRCDDLRGLPPGAEIVTAGGPPALRVSKAP